MGTIFGLFVQVLLFNLLRKKAKDPGGGTPDSQDGVQLPAASLLSNLCSINSLYCNINSSFASKEV